MCCEVVSSCRSWYGGFDTYAMYTAGWKDGGSGDFCASGLTVGSTGRAVSREASTEDLAFSSEDMVACGD